jgi:hypothetical protein
MKFEELIGRDGIVVGYQATYIIVAVGGLELHVDIEGKSEFRIRQGTGGQISLVSEHPLLLEHGEPWSETYINSKPADPIQLIEDISTAIKGVTGIWRDWKRYVTKGELFRFSNFTQNIAKGNGMLSYAPISITQAIVKACQEAGVSTFSTDGDFRRSSKKVLRVGKNFVVADDFVGHSESSAQQGLLR